MPNYVDTTVTIAMPSEAARTDLMAALAGPEDWYFPVGAMSAQEIQAVHGIDVAPASSHAQLEIARLGAAEIAAVRAARSGLRFPPPDWMPVSRACAIALRKTGALPDIQLSALSLPRLAPISSRAEFDKLIAGAMDAAGFWSASRVMGSGICEARIAKCGTKWGLFDLRVETDTIEGRPCVEFTFRTAWSPVMALHDILAAEVVPRGGALALTWCEEQGFGEILHVTSGGEVSVEDFDMDRPGFSYLERDGDDEFPVFDHAQQFDRFDAHLGEAVDTVSTPS